MPEKVFDVFFYLGKWCSMGVEMNKFDFGKVIIHEEISNTKCGLWGGEIYHQR